MKFSAILLSAALMFAGVVTALPAPDPAPIPVPAPEAEAEAEAEPLPMELSSKKCAIICAAGKPFCGMPRKYKPGPKKGGCWECCPRKK